MLLRKLCLLLLCMLSSNFAWASSDNNCGPDWSFSQRGYDRCSNMPILTPDNDTRVNLKLLLVADGFARLQTKPNSKENTEYGYGKVPFSLDNFENNIFIFRNKTDSSNNEKESVSKGEGTRCISNETGKADFIDALDQSKDLTADERKRLTEERQKLNPGCVDAPASGTSNPVNIPNTNSIKSGTSSTFNQFIRYLAAAAAFYEGRYGEAESGFADLNNSAQPWLKEASLYMLGRTELNRSQQHAFDSAGFPDLDKVEKKALLKAEEKFKAYLKEYPGGLYASSARGLLRRVYWFSKQPQKLADEYTWQLNNPESPQHNLSINEFAQEVDSKLLVMADPKLIKNPLLLATLDLSLMRKAGSSATKQISFSDLQKQQPVFAGHKALYEYLLAAHLFYVQKDALNTLKTLTDTIPENMTYLDFSRLALRGLALEAKKDYPGARKLWLTLLHISRQPLQSETLQLALALNYEYSNNLELVFERNSPITEPIIRSILLRSSASANLLRRIIKSKSSSARERDIALYTLLYKDLLQGHYHDYIRDYKLLPGDADKYKASPVMDYSAKPQLARFTWSGKNSDDGYSCPSTLAIAGKLANNLKDPYGLICLGDFVHSNGLDSDAVLSGYSPSRSSDAKGAVLGSAPSHFPGEIFSRGEGYKIVIADANVKPDLKAYALYRSIQCYAPTGYNHCGGKDVDKTVRKSWFQTLKKRYAHTLWAQSLKYYW
jgi:hypothetical protein